MKVVIAQTYRAYREYCDHRMLDRSEYRFVSKPHSLDGLIVADEDVHYADATSYAMLADPHSGWLRALSMLSIRSRNAERAHSDG